MSLATRCSACGTVFRVVQDQLKVSEGWVRCGRCNEVFNALEGLFDLDRESPPEWDPQERDEWARQASPAQAAVDDERDGGREEPVVSDPQLVDRIDSQLFGARVAQAREAAEHAEPSAPVPPLGELDDRVSREPRFDAGERLATGDDVGGEAPDFLLRAERSERWKRPWVRAVLGVIALSLAATLALQGVHHFRDEVAARVPEASPILSAWCGAVGCTIDAPRRIDDVAVESTALSRVGSAEAYRLAIVLRNHGAVNVATPAVDLALTDATGQLIARRTLSARDFATAPDRLLPGGDANLQAIVTAGASRITGYTVELFYP